MPHLYACLISDVERPMLTAVAHKFASSIEMLDDGILFDVSGLERLIGKPERVAQKILAEVKLSRIPASVGVADTVDAAVLLARQQTGAEQSVHLADTFEQLPLRDLDIEQDTLNVFTDLGLKRIEDLLAIPRSELVSRYGREFQNVIDTIEQRGTSLITPNVKETSVEWKFDLDQPVENFEQLIFVLNHGLEWLFAEVDRGSHSCEHLDLDLKLRNAGRKSYEIKVSFPTLERTFWLKLINLRAALDPPESEIVAIRVTAHFTKPRAAQRGLYAVSRPEPENLLLTVNKLKRLVGEENVGVPVLLDQRMAEPFTLDADAMPQGRERLEIVGKRPVVGFTYFRPPVRAEVLIRDRQLVFLKTRYFAGHILNFSGVWKGYAKWWDTPWKTLEWDVEVENDGIYRLAKAGDEWFLIGEYD